VHVRWWLVAALLHTQVARAQDAPPVSQTRSYSHYEAESIKTAEKTLGGEVDRAPEGKVIETIEVVPLEVIEERDPAPKILNWLHATTRPYVIKREVLMKVGDPFRKVLADETARNLRRFPQLSLVVCTAFRGSTKDRVRLVVVAKDVWSLRLGSAYGITGGGLESLSLEPTESNLAGTHHSVFARFTYNPSAYSLGIGYRIPRLDGRRLTFGADANVIMNQASGKPEGSYGSIGISRPLFSTRTEWSWLVSTVWRIEVIRRFVNAQLDRYDAEATPAVDDRIPFEYRGRRFAQSAEITRSYGWASKHDFSVGAEINRRVFRTFDLERFDPAAVREFETRNLPIGETRVGPYFEYRAYRNDYLRVLDLETLALQEDYRMGHDIQLRAYPVTKALGSDRNFFGLFAAAQYTVPLGDGLARVGVESTTEAEVERLTDAAFAAFLRIATPRLGFGRIIFDAAVLHRYRNYLNRLTFLGGDTRLRGYSTNQFIGKDVLAYNVEFRSRPLEILSCQAAAALFYDSGDAFNGFERFRPKHTLGFGLRFLFPQLNRVVFRVDVGFPIGARGDRAVPPELPIGVPGSFFLAFEQAYGLNTIGGTVATGGLAGSSGSALGQ
jgi:hypothetical protein